MKHMFVVKTVGGLTVDHLYRKRSYITLPGQQKPYFPRHGSYLIKASKIQQPHLKYGLDLVCKKEKLLIDYDGNPENFGEILRHLESKGINIESALNRLQVPGRNEYLEPFFYEHSSQNGNNK